MPIIYFTVHPKHDPFMPRMWETWELLITGLLEVQFIALTQHSSEIFKKTDDGNDNEEQQVVLRNKNTRRRRPTTLEEKKITAVYYIDGAGPGKFPPISGILPFIKEIKSWGFKLIHISCPARDEFSSCIFQKS